MSSIKPYSKAMVAIVGAVVTGLTQVFPDNPDVSRWCAFVMSVLTVAAVYLVPNADPAGTHQAESVQPPTDLGAGMVEGVGDIADGILPEPKDDDPKPLGGYWGGV